MQRLVKRREVRHCLDQCVYVTARANLSTLTSDYLQSICRTLFLVE